MNNLSLDHPVQRDILVFFIQMMCFIRLVIEEYKIEVNPFIESIAQHQVLSVLRSGKYAFFSL